MKTIVLFSLLVILSCSESERILEYKKEIMQTEQAFAQMAREKGAEKAFLTFAADSAVLYRNGKIIKGRESFIRYFSDPFWNDVQLAWTPEFIDVSSSGDLAYTYGFYTLTLKDSSNKVSKSHGIFHTVWKRQKDGSWKFVWD